MNDNHDSILDENAFDVRLPKSANVAYTANESVTTNNAYITLGYEDTDFTRKYKFAGVADSVLSSIATRVQEYNASVPAADKNVFVSDDGDKMTGIVGVTVEQVTTEYIIKR